MNEDSKNTETQPAESKSSIPYKTIPVREDTHSRLTAFKHANPFDNKSFDEAVNEILDTIDFPQADEFESIYTPSYSNPTPTKADD